MFPEKQLEYIKMSESYLADFVTACPSAAEIANKIRGHISSQNLYKGLKGVQELIEYETYVLQTFNEGIEEMDASVGAIVDSIRSNVTMARNTLIIFTSVGGDYSAFLCHLARWPTVTCAHTQDMGGTML